MRVVMPIIRVRPGSPLKVVIRSACWYGRITHYVNKRTVLCTEEADCEFCGQTIGLWKGFAVVRAFSSERLALLSITPPVVNTLLAGMKGRPSAAGLTVAFRRVGARLNAPLTCETFGYREGEPEVSIEETRSYVERIFRPKRSFTLYTGMPQKKIG